MENSSTIWILPPSFASETSFSDQSETTFLGRKKYFHPDKYSLKMIKLSKKPIKIFTFLIKIMLNNLNKPLTNYSE